MPVDLRSRLKATDLRVLQLDVLSANAMGSSPIRIYEDPHLRRQLVGKELQPPPDILADPSRRPAWLASTIAEGRIQEQLRRSEYVLDVYAVLDVHGADGQPTGALEVFTPYVPGGSLYDHWRAGGRFDTAEAVKIMRDVSLGLADLHDLGYLHRDVKSLNAFVEHTQRGPKGLLGDLGLAIAQSPDGRAEGYPQPTPWIAPEQMDPIREATVVSDLFGIATCLVDLLRPSLAEGFDGAARDAAAQRMTRGHLPLPARRYVPPPWTPPRVRRLIRGLIRSDPNGRKPRSARAVADALDTPVPPWTEILDAPDAFEYAAVGRVSVSIKGRYLRRTAEWEISAAADRGSGQRSTQRGRHPNATDTVLEGYFDAALTSWSR